MKRLHCSLHDFQDAGPLQTLHVDAGLDSLQQAWLLPAGRPVYVCVSMQMALMCILLRDCASLHFKPQHASLSLSDLSCDVCYRNVASGSVRCSQEVSDAAQSCVNPAHQASWQAL